MCLIITETNNGHNFQFTKFSVTDFFLNDRKKGFQVHSQNWPVAIFQKSISVLSREKSIIKATEYVTFGFSSLQFGLLPLLGNFERQCL